MTQLTIPITRYPVAPWVVIVPGQPIAWHHEARSGRRHMRPELRRWVELAAELAAEAKPAHWSPGEHLVRVTVDLFHGDRCRRRRRESYSESLLEAFAYGAGAALSVRVRHHHDRAQPRAEINLEIME